MIIMIFVIFQPSIILVSIIMIMQAIILRSRIQMICSKGLQILFTSTSMYFLTKAKDCRKVKCYSVRLGLFGAIEDQCALLLVKIQICIGSIKQIPTLLGTIMVC